MGMEVLAGASLAMGGLNMMAQIGAAGQASKLASRTYAANLAAARANIGNEYAEIKRQQDESFEQSVVASSDRIRKAKDEIGSLRVLAGEMGSGDTTFDALVRENAYAEGADLSRIDTNLKSRVAAGEAAKKAAQQNFTNTVTGAGLQLAGAQMQADNAKTAAIMGFIGSGLRIGAQYSANQDMLAAIKRRDQRTT